jgi:hypothetical protein
MSKNTSGGPARPQRFVRGGPAGRRPGDVNSDKSSLGGGGGSKGLWGALFGPTQREDHGGHNNSWKWGSGPGNKGPGKQGGSWGRKH